MGPGPGLGERPGASLTGTEFQSVTLRKSWRGCRGSHTGANVFSAHDPYA